MALEGTIRDFGLPDIFQLIGLQKKTGLLTLKNEKEEMRQRTDIIKAASMHLPFQTLLNVTVPGNPAMAR